MPFWSDWLRSVTQRAPLARPPLLAAPDDVAPLVPLVPVAARDESARDESARAPRRRAATRADARPAPTTTVSAASAPVVPVVIADAPTVAARRERDASETFGGDGADQWHARVFDLLADGVMLFDAQGQTAYRNAAATALTDDEGHQVLRDARALALAVLAPDAARRAAGRDAARELTLGAIHFRLSAVAIPASLPHTSLPPVASAPAALVIITRTSPALPSPSVLRRRFQLTAREASVALLLAEGRSNAGVARRLGISENTVRHYIETVLLKLDVPSRAAVAAALLGVYEHTDEHALPRTRKTSVAD